MVKGGYGAITAALAAGLNVRLSCPVARVSDDSSGVHITLADGASLTQNGMRHLRQGKASHLCGPGCLIIWPSPCVSVS